MTDITKGYEGFYEMVRRWVVFDHYNPTVRGEMIWDMLLSDFVCDLMRTKYDPDGTAGEVVLLAKEFPYSKNPYRRDDNEALSGPKVDYLVGIDDVLYFVELKTTPGSYDKEQYEAYMRYVNSDSRDGFSVEDLWDRYIEIAQKAGSGKKYHEYAGSKKYRFQLDKMKEACGRKEADDSRFLDELKDRYKSIKLAYITFEKIPGLDEKCQIILYKRDGSDACKIRGFDAGDAAGDAAGDKEKAGKKQQRWSMVLDIIKEAMEG